MKLILNSVFSNLTSYGSCGINIVLALEKRGVTVEAIPIGNASFQKNQNLYPSLDRGRFFSYDADCIRLFHEFDLSTRHSRGRHIGFPIFEKTNFSEQEIHQLNCPDRLFVTTKWAKQIIEDNNIKTSTDVVNLGVDVDVFKPRTIKDSPYTFFFPGKFEIRKSFDLCLSIFEKAFTIKDDIKIIFLPINKFFSNEENQEWINYLISSSLASKIEILSPIETNEDVANIYQETDCVVSFSRAEGWNLCLTEGLASGCDVVATNYSSHTEYLTNENSYIVDVDGLESAIDGKWFLRPENQWALIGEKCKNGLAEALREVYKKGKKINHSGIETANKFTWDNTAKLILDSLNK